MRRATRRESAADRAAERTTRWADHTPLNAPLNALPSGILRQCNAAPGMHTSARLHDGPSAVLHAAMQPGEASPSVLTPWHRSGPHPAWQTDTPRSVEKIGEDAREEIHAGAGRVRTRKDSAQYETQLTSPSHTRPARPRLVNPTWIIHPRSFNRLPGCMTPTPERLIRAAGRNTHDRGRRAAREGGWRTCSVSSARAFAFSGLSAHTVRMLCSRSASFTMITCTPHPPSDLHTNCCLDQNNDGGPPPPKTPGLVPVFTSSES